MMEYLWYVFEIIGTIAFAISGALVGVARRMDIFGMTVLALATAIGGGIIRDILVGRIPPNSLTSGLYVGITIVVTLLIFLMYRRDYRKMLAVPLMGKWSRILYLIADALGLASFTVTGASVGYILFPHMATLIVILGVVTAVGGGIIRDVLAKRIPSVLKEEVYALPSIIGGIIYYVMSIYDMGIMKAYISFMVVFIIRMLAVYFHWELPKIS